MPKPHMVAYGTQKNGDKTFWTRIGVAFPNQDGSINLVLNYLPLNGKVQLREPKEGEE